MAPPRRRGRLGSWRQSPLGSFASHVHVCDLLTPAAVAASADQVPRGQWAPLDEFRTLLIDRSAESVESFLPVRGVDLVSHPRAPVVSSLL